MALEDADLPAKTRRPVTAALGGSKLAYSIPEFCAASGIGRTRIYAAIGEKRLRARKFGARTVILAEDGRAFLASLPEFRAT